LQDGYGEQFGASYRTIQKLFDLLILRKVQAEAHSSRSEQLHKEGHAGSHGHGQSHGGNAAGGAGKDKDREHAANRRKSSFGLASGGGGGSVGIASNSDETDGATSGDSSSDDAAPFTFSLSVSMMEIYNEQVRTAIQ
jgi:hypothetical protein